jgi:hypothetical protein
MRGRIEDHFARRLKPAAERSMREHLPGCAACKRYYERHLLLQRLDPKASEAQARLGQALGLVPAPVSRVARGGAMLAAAAVLALGIYVTRPTVPALSDSEQASGFSARGGPVVTQPEPLRVYRIRTGLAPEPVQGELRATDELAFAYQNAAGKKWLLIYGVDEHGHVYWFHPSWSDPDADPSAVPAQAGEGLHELPEAISHALDGGKLTLHEVLSDERLTVRRAESLMQGREPGEPLPVPDAVTTSLSV